MGVCNKQAVTQYPRERGLRLNRPTGLSKLSSTSEVTSAEPKMQETSMERGFQPQKLLLPQPSPLPAEKHHVIKKSYMPSNVECCELITKSCRKS